MLCVLLMADLAWTPLSRSWGQIEATGWVELEGEVGVG